MHRKPRADRALALECSTNAATAPFKEREFRHGLLLLAFFAEDKLTAIFDALALVRLRLAPARSEEHTSELQSLMRISYAVFCLQKKTSDLHHNNFTHTSISLL